MTPDDRTLDLLASRATEGLDPASALELERLLDREPDWRGDDFELVAAATHVGLLRRQPLEPMPRHLRARVLADAERLLPPAPARGFDLRGMGWYAAAAMLVLAVWAPWSTRPPVERPLPPAEAREALVAGAPDVVIAAWSAAESEYDGVGGDVVWSTERQAGFMRLRGLPANRPAERQYQLWIVDPTRDEEPVDGGVFDVPAGSDEVIVPIDPKLAIAEPTVFAITLEQPGGVVVSEGPLLVVASLG